MKKLSALLCAFVLLSSCEQDFSVNGEAIETTVIYGLLDASKKTNLVRIERGWLGSEAASVSFSIPDSLYYDTADIDVFLEEYDINDDGSSGGLRKTIPMSPDFDIRSLEPNGPFTTEGFRLYRSSEFLDEDMRYRIVVRHKDGRPDAYAETELIGAFNPSNNSGFRLIKPLFNQVPSLYIGTIEWKPSRKARVYEVDIYFVYKEFNTITKISQFDTLKLEHKTVKVTENQSLDFENISANSSRADLYQQIAGKLGPKADVLRFFENMRFVVWAGGEELVTYSDLNQPSASLNQARPEFPQVVNGTGLFSSRTKFELDDIEFSANLKSEYYLSPALCDLQFAVAEAGDTCFCDTQTQTPEKRCD